MFFTAFTLDTKYSVCYCKGLSYFHVVNLHFYIILLEALKDIKAYFKGPENAMEPSTSTHAVADGTIKSIGHLFAATICNYGPAPNFLVDWVFNYILGGSDRVLQHLPKQIENSSKLGIVYNEVSVWLFLLDMYKM